MRRGETRTATGLLGRIAIPTEITFGPNNSDVSRTPGSRAAFQHPHTIRSARWGASARQSEPSSFPTRVRAPATVTTWRSCCWPPGVFDQIVGDSQRDTGGGTDTGEAHTGRRLLHPCHTSSVSLASRSLLPMPPRGQPHRWVVTMLLGACCKCLCGFDIGLGFW